MADTFRALLAELADGKSVCTLTDLGYDSLPPGEVTIGVEYSSLNYKDGLAVTGAGKVIRKFPMVPGIDLAGTVASSESPEFRAGERVLVTGYGLGEDHFGGYAQRARVKAAWVVRVPESLSNLQAMAIGTAGFTAMLSVMALEHQGLQPGQGDVLVTGAAGGVGGISVALLAKLGYRVVASTGRPETHDYLQGLGAAECMDRALLSEPTKRPLEKERWAGAVDSVGGVTLANVLKQVKYHGSVAACGLAGGGDLPTAVFPFILRGVSLLGIDSNQCPMPRRLEAWRRLGSELPLDLLDSMTQVVPLSNIGERAREILAGKVRGRTVVDCR